MNDERGRDVGYHGVLFVCSGNTCRSAMAAALFAAQAGDGWLVESAGLHAARGAPAAKGAVAVLAQAGIDLSLHRAKPIEDVLLDLFPLVLVMTGEHRRDLLERYPRLDGCVFLLAEMAGENEDVVDPYGENILFYSRTATKIKEYLEQGREKIEEMAVFQL